MAAEDTFESSQPGLTAPGQSAAEITPNNSTDLTTATRGIYVGVSGDLKVDTLKGDTVTFVGLSAGVIHPIRATRIYATGTDADDIVAVW